MKQVITLYLCLTTFHLQAQKLDTLTQLNQLKTDKGLYKAPNGKVYKISVEKAEWSDDDEVIKDRGILNDNCLDSLYSGKDRESAKTSIVAGRAKIVATVSDLIKLLPKDSIMRKKVKKKSPRVAEEDTYLYAFAKEEDGDYHIIIGDHFVASKATFFNVEISGLLSNDLNSALSQPRRAFEEQFVGMCSSDYIIFIDNPLKIDVQGSLFFDVSHIVGQVGPKKLKPQTNWEIHPVSKIRFID
jgi:hypothetical protein